MFFVICSEHDFGDKKRRYMGLTTTSMWKMCSGGIFCCLENRSKVKGVKFTDIHVLIYYLGGLFFVKDQQTMMGMISSIFSICDAILLN